MRTRSQVKWELAQLKQLNIYYYFTNRMVAGTMKVVDALSLGVRQGLGAIKH